MLVQFGYVSVHVVCVQVYKVYFKLLDCLALF